MERLKKLHSYKKKKESTFAVDGLSLEKHFADVKDEIILLLKMSLVRFHGQDPMKQPCHVIFTRQLLKTKNYPLFDEKEMLWPVKSLLSVLDTDETYLMLSRQWKYPKSS